MEDLFGGDLGARLAAFAASATAIEAAAARTRQHWLRQADLESATLRGVFVDLAERGVAAAFHVVSGRLHRGAVVGVGADCCTLRTTSGGPVFVAIDAIDWVRPDVSLAPTGDRDADCAFTLAGALAAYAGDHPRVSVGFRGGGEPLVGELRTVGGEVATIATEASGRATLAPIAGIADVVVVR